MENVWDYPRPPAVDRCTRRVRITLGGITIVDTTRALRVLETSHPPTIYIPREDLDDGILTPAISRRTYCEWKGWASYFDVAAGTGEATVRRVGLPGSDRRLRVDHRPRRVLSGPDGRVPAGRRARPGAAGRLLRWLGDRRHSGHGQGRTRHLRLVVALTPRRRFEHDVEQPDGAGLVQRLVAVAALRRLHARRAARRGTRRRRSRRGSP